MTLIIYRIPQETTEFIVEKLHQLDNMNKDLQKIKKDVSDIRNAYNMIEGEICYDTYPACAFLHISDRHLRRFKDRGILTAYEIGKKCIYKISDLIILRDKYLKSKITTNGEKAVK